MAGRRFQDAFLWADPELGLPMEAAGAGGEVPTAVVPDLPLRLQIAVSKPRRLNRFPWETSAPPAGITTIKVHNGSNWVNVNAVKVHNGSTWVDVAHVHVHNGSGWVQIV